MKFGTYLKLISLIAMTNMSVIAGVAAVLRDITGTLYFLMLSVLFMCFPFIYCKLYEKKHGKYALQKLLESEV